MRSNYENGNESACSNCILTLLIKSNAKQTAACMCRMFAVMLLLPIDIILSKPLCMFDKNITITQTTIAAVAIQKEQHQLCELTPHSSMLHVHIMYTVPHTLPHHPAPKYPVRPSLRPLKSSNLNLNRTVLKLSLIHI